MTLQDIINKTCDGQRVKVTIAAFGMKFTTEHSAEFYTDLEEEDRKILEKEVKNIRAEDGELCVTLV